MRLLGAVLLCCLFAGLARPAAAPQRTMEFDIAAQPLSSALFRFTGQSGIQVLAADTQQLEQRARAVRGRMTPEAALTRLLAGTGLAFRHVDAGTIAVLRAPGSARTVPPPSDAGTEQGAGEAAASEAEVADLIEVQEIHVTGTRI